MLLCFAKESGSDITHVCFFQFVVLTVHLVDPDVFECGYDGGYVETHGYESIDQILVITVISAVQEEEEKSISLKLKN